MQPILLLSYLSLNLFISVIYAEPGHSQPHNANHIFNAIHSSMRQWGSSLNHNGMSMFLASVPAGTQLYHGTSKSDPIEGMEWLAFEPEHALIFARSRRGPPPGEGNRPPRDGEEPVVDDAGVDWKHPHSRPDRTEHKPDRRPHPKPDHGKQPATEPHRPIQPGMAGSMPAPYPPNDPPSHYKDHPPQPLSGLRPITPEHRGPPNPGHRRPPPQGPHENYLPRPPKHHNGKRESQKPLKLATSQQDSETGYLHTYIPKHDLRLLYIDGLSAGKTSNGTLDTQDMLLLNISGLDGPMGGEYQRAIGMCNLTSTLWEGKIDGILRMEGGFEIILCDFKKHLERTGSIAVGGEGDRGGPGGFMGGWRYMQAIASRYHGIGGQRVSVDYDAFVSVFAYSNIEGLFTNDVQSDYTMPRLQNVKEADRNRVKDDITELILRKNWDGHKTTTNWQSIADMVIERYSAPLHYLHTDKAIRKDKDALAKYLTALLRPFISSTDRNATLETQRCVSQLVPAFPSPPQPAAPLALRTLHTVTSHICDVLLTSLSVASSQASHSTPQVYASHVADLVDRLVEYLNWSTWKQCRTCSDNQVCFIPIWPSGTHEDHAHPQCKSEEEASGRNGYWGHRWGPGPPRKGKGEGRRP
jgi:hypothetical protein